MNTEFVEWWRGLTAEGKRDAAEGLRSTQGHLNNVAGGFRPLSGDLGVGIEFLTRGALTVEQLCPDITWRRMADPDWPHPDGKPYRDVRPPEAATATAPPRTETPPLPPHPVLVLGDLRGLAASPGPNLGRRKSDAEALERERLAAVVDAGPPIYCFGPVPRLTERHAHAQPADLDVLPPDEAA